MAKADATVEELVGMIHRGELRLPEMQRRYVWKKTRVRDLVDSLYRGYPSGTILLWETDDEDIPLQEFSIDQNTNPYRTMRLLLDGQQRLTSLSAVIRGEPVVVRYRKRPIDLLFNLDHPEHPAAAAPDFDEDSDDDDDILPDETEASEDELQRRFESMAFVVASKKLEKMPHWVKVSDVFKTDADAPFLQAAGVENFSDPRFQKYSQRLARLRGIRKYVYRIDILERALEYEQVTEIFVRVNSLGAKLRSSDLALAQITAKWRHSLDTFQDFQDQCAKAGFDLDLGLYIKALIAFATGQSRFRSVVRIPAETLQTAWNESCRGFEFAINFMKQNVSIDSPILLSSPFILITVAIFGRQQKYELTPDQADRLRFWILLASAKGRYSRGSSETLLDQDLTSILRGAGVDDLVERLRLQVGRLDISPEELEGKNQRSALFKTMFLAFKDRGATDWRSNLAISLDHSGKQHRLQFHHIFPKTLLKKIATNREADDIANLAFVGGGTNRRLSDKPPSEYIPRFVEKNSDACFVAQGIPIEASLLNVTAYREFLAERRKNIAHILNTFLNTDKLVGETGRRSLKRSDVIDINALVDQGEGVEVEYKSTLRINRHTGQADPRMEREVLKTIAAFVNSNGGTLIVGIDDEGLPVGVGADKFPSEDKMNLHLVNLIRDRIGAQNMAFIHPQFVDYENTRVLVVQCQRGRAPVYVKDGNMEHFFMRSGAATTELTGNQMQQYIKHRF